MTLKTKLEAALGLLRLRRLHRKIVIPQGG
jgi:hypothetical protein